MNEMEQLTQFRAEVPLGVTPRAEQLYRTGLEQELSAEHRVVARPGFLRRALAGLRGVRPAWRYAITVPVAAGLVAGVLV
ncbi:MAG TPA: hypothetical protein VGG16_08955, partial [Streptosporangiaceae bacterium]